VAEGLMGPRSSLLLSSPFLAILLQSSLAAAQSSAPAADVEVDVDAGAQAEVVTEEEVEVAAPPAEPPAPPEKPKEKGGKPLSVAYDKGISISSEDGGFKTRIGIRGQFRFEASRPLEDGSTFSNRLAMQRSRLNFEGNFFGEDNKYKLDLGLNDRGSFGYVRELYIDRKVGPAYLRAGQWKRPFNRQEITSDFASQFNERANTADFVGGGRDLGVGIHNDYEKSPEGIEWVVGVFNGFAGGTDRPVINTRCTPGDTSISCTTPAPTNVPSDWGPSIFARVGWNSKDMKGYSEADLEGGGLRYAVGLGYKVDLADFDQGSQESTADNMSHGLQADAMVKVSGFSLHLGGYMLKVKSADPKYGALAQAGMFVIPKKAEVVARFAIVPFSGDRDQLEVRGAFNYYFEGHRFKWATDLGMLKATGEDPTTMAKDDPDLLLRSMLQFMF
jgi:Phosphate-selective porin O and P